MNDQIKAIINQAWSEVNKQEPDLPEVAFWEKFVELIVRECAAQRRRNVIVGGVSEYNRGRHEMAEDILKHFGLGEPTQ